MNVIKRRRSPSCGSRLSAQYRDSHASRLRHDRNRSLSEDRKSEQRSTSSSPTKNFTRSLSSKQPSSNDSAPQSPERGSDAPSRTARKSSNICKDVKENFATSSNNIRVDKPKPTSGYGKPLMTSIYKKLTLRQEIYSRTSLAASDKSPSRLARSRPPTPSKENKNTPNAAASIARDTRQQRASINTVSGSRKKVPIISTTSSLRSDSNCSNTKTMLLTKPIKQIIMQQRISSSSKRQSLDTNDDDASSSKRQFSKIRLPVVKKRSLSRENIKNVEAVIKSTCSSRDSLNARAKVSSTSRDVKASPINGKKTTNQSSKSFKPQLEDIKSSLLLLNKTKSEENYEIDKMFLSKLQPMRGKQRNEKLLEVIKKYKTKKYWNDSSTH
ncbi:uncharacterized protein LOC135193432 [Vanessa tameamea]|uniref:Uncharacterized protein LOC135193432 n=1 Tax=Vanessa tameamea TaxID=334116 RepID=A0ABM4AKW6_VANTA